MTGAFTALALATALVLAYGLARWAGVRERLAPPASLVRIPRPPKTAADWLGLLRFAWLFTAAVVALLLVFDPRYRDFPLALFAPPALGFLLHALAGAGEWEAWPPAEGEERLLAGWLAASAPLIVAMEGLAN